MYKWKDLEKWVNQRTEFLDSSREVLAVGMLLAGEKIDLNFIPSVQGGRSPGKVRKSIKKLLKDHDGVESDGNTYWIKDLVK